MILIISKQKRKYWVDKYEIQKDFYVMKRATKEGKLQTIMIPTSEIAEIVLNSEEALDKFVQKKVK